MRYGGGVFLIDYHTTCYLLLLTQYHQVPTSTSLSWPITIIYQPVPPYTIIRSSHISVCRCFKNQQNHLYFKCRSLIVLCFYKSYMSKHSNVRISFVDLRWAQLYVSLVSQPFLSNGNADLFHPRLTHALGGEYLEQYFFFVFERSFKIWIFYFSSSKDNSKSTFSDEAWWWWGAGGKEASSSLEQDLIMQRLILTDKHESHLTCIESS